jgi:serine/threonine protein kinase
MDKAAFLSSVRGFTEVPAPVLQEISHHLEERRYADGDVLMRRGDPGDVMHVVRRGAVRVISASGETLTTLGAAEVVGEMALLSGEPRNADVVAEGPTTTLTLARDVIAPLIRSHPSLARFLTALVNLRLDAGTGSERVGKYEVERRLGKGATARVYRASHPDLGRTVAIKMLSHALSFDPGFTSRFLDEARTIAGLAHPNIVQIYDAEASFGTYFLVMEYVEGSDADELLREAGRLDAARAASILSQMAEALRYAHSHGVIHRDVKPANCMIGTDGEVKLMDFGMAKRMEQSAPGTPSMVVDGTPNYLSPEAAMGQPIDGRADIYSLGVMAFELLVGERPFGSDSLRTLLQMHVRKPPPDITRLRPDLPPGLTRFVQGALTKRREDRLSDWDEILRLLAPPSKRSMSRARREVITLDYPDAESDRVDAALARLRAELAGGEGIEVGRARLESAPQA